MRLSDHNKTLAAKHLGLTRFALDRRLKKQLEHESTQRLRTLRRS